MCGIISLNAGEEERTNYNIWLLHRKPPCAIENEAHTCTVNAKETGSTTFTRPFAAITDIIAKDRFSLQLDDLSVSSKFRLSQKRAGFFYVFVCAEITEYRNSCQFKSRMYVTMPKFTSCSSGNGLEFTLSDDILKDYFQEELFFAKFYLSLKHVSMY